jgi:hypothetical protein
MFDLTANGSESRGTQLDILGMKDKKIWTSLPDPAQGMAFDAVRLDDGWQIHTEIKAYDVVGFEPAELGRLRRLFNLLPFDWGQNLKLSTIKFDASAPNAAYQRAGETLTIDPNTRRDGTLEYVMSHELAHAWSYTFGSKAFAGSSLLRFVGPDFAGGADDYERCYPCGAGTTNIDDCYAAGNARKALDMGPQVDPEKWAERMQAFDEDFAESVAAFLRFRRNTVWLDENLNRCTPTKRMRYMQNVVRLSVPT